MTAPHDIAVLGASAAGCAAAGILARGGCRVALVEYAGVSCESPLADWVPRGFWLLPGVPSSARESCRGGPLRVVRYHNPALERQAALSLRPDGGSLLDTGDLKRSMLEAARKAGAAVVRLASRPAIRLGEDSVLLRGSRDLAARLLLIAQGSPQEALGDLALPVRPQPRSPFAVAGLDARLPGGKARKELAGTLNLVAFRQRGKMGVFFAAGESLHLRLVWSAGEGSQAAAELSAFFRDLKKARLLPPELSLRGARGAVWRPPAGEALDLETHSAKRCLLLGTAGGFADSISGATLYASVRSAAIAAEAARSALAAADPQEPLMRYKNEWRKLLAEGLRPPSTSVDLLLPLLMTNRKLVEKFTRAMLYGRSI